MVHDLLRYMDFDASWIRLPPLILSSGPSLIHSLNQRTCRAFQLARFCAKQEQKRGSSYWFLIRVVSKRPDTKGVGNRYGHPELRFGMVVMMVVVMMVVVVVV